MSIRTKILSYISLLIVFVYILGCFLFINILKRQHAQDMKKRSAALEMQFSYDNEIISSFILSQHEFAETTPKKIQLLKNNDEMFPHTIGFVQIGLRTQKIDKKIYHTVLICLIPTGVVFIFGGICLAFFLSKRVMSPLRCITEITQEIARGNFTRAVSIQSQDEIGLLAMNVNTMTKALESSYNELKQEIEKRKVSEAQLVLLIDRDPLTNLFNRRRFHKELELCMEQTQRYGSNGALMFLDLDNFKQVNDTLGHQKGDELLVTIARLLRKRLRQLDLVARLGGDEFAVILPHTNEEQAQLISEQILASIITATEHINVTASIGIALFPAHGIDANTLLNCADTAMYKAKQEGRNRIYVYSMEMTLLTEV